MGRSPDDDDYVPHGARERRASTPRAGKRPDVAATGRPRREAKSEVRKQIERGLNCDASGSRLAAQVGHVARECDRPTIAAARAMLYALDRAGSPIAAHPTAAARVVEMAARRSAFVRRFDDFDPTAFSPQLEDEDAAGEQPSAMRELRRLAGHFFERWPVPHWLDDAWRIGPGPRREWFIHLGAGGNLVAAPGLPYPLTKRMAHFATTFDEGPCDAFRVLRWGQLRGLGVPEELCRELLNTRLAGGLPDEPFWRSVGAWFANFPEVFGHTVEIVDYLFAQRIGDFRQPIDPRFSMRGRTPDRLLRDVREWHLQFVVRRARGMAPAALRWASCGVEGFRPTPPPDQPATQANELPTWRIDELLSAHELEREGDAMRHCVSTYARQASQGDSAIYSLRRLVRGEYESTTTIEVRPREREIVQARAKCNARPTPDDERLVKAWASRERLRIAAYVFA